LTTLLKIGGTLLEEESSRSRLARDIGAATRHGARIVVVHGGGRQMTRFLEERGVSSRFVNGLRVTTDEVLDAVVKVVAGSVNKQLVSAFVNAGYAAVGISGIDANLVTARPLSAELGHVGQPDRADPRLLETLLDGGFLPVVACVAGDREGRMYNINADQMAVACARALRADRLVFLTDVAGVRGRTGQTEPALDARHCRELIQEGVAAGGMQAKLEAALLALAGAVSEVIVGPGAEENIVPRILAGEAVGTRITPVPSEALHG